MAPEASEKQSCGSQLAQVGRRGQEPSKEAGKKEKGSAVVSASSSLGPGASTSGAGALAGGALACYGVLRLGIKTFHLTRRVFLRQLLIDVSSAFDELGVTHWVDFGGLLGIHRNGDLILHDNDIDLSVLNPEWVSLEAGLRKLLPNYSVAVVVPSEDPTTQFMRVYCPLGMCDLFGALDTGNGLLSVDCGHGDTTAIPQDLVLPTQKMVWRGAKLTVPRDVPGALEHRYGKDWRTPRYMDKGADVLEGQKLYARIFRGLSKVGIRL